MKSNALSMRLNVNASRLHSDYGICYIYSRSHAGRSIRELIRCMALGYGLRLNWGNTDRDALLTAAVASVYDDMAFCAVLKQCTEIEA